MDEPSDRIGELREQATQVRVRAIEANKVLIAELSRIWQELNELATGRPDVRKICTQIAGDIARLEKVDLAFDTEWLAEAKRARP
ncbi:MAG: hypothetical protein IT193_11385 [Propionibacteriaceae bacterium]|nr:hypothetical protein [Propionibacteriaceae bacterium]